MSFNNWFRYCLIIIVSLILLNFNVKKKGKVRIEFSNVVDGQELILDSLLYKNSIGQAYSISKIRYYIGNITLEGSDGRIYSNSEYYLVDEENQNSKTIKFEDVPEGYYTRLSFIVGVDSLHNCSGVQSGSLDPMNAMFWGWDTGYIFFKLEGKSLDCKTPSNFFEYHIGGYQYPFNAIRKIELKFQAPIYVSNVNNSKIQISSNIAEALRTPNDIDFRDIPVLTTKKNASLIADNYCDMFAITKIVNEK